MLKNGQYLQFHDYKSQTTLSMQKVEFHCHTIWSKDSLVHPIKLLEACQRKDIQRVVITDHNTITGALYAQDLDPQRVIIGEEIMTTQGEILAFFLNEEIPGGLEPSEAIFRLRQQGAFISISHPFDSWREGSWEVNALLEILPLVDSIETFNSRCMQPSANEQAQIFAMEHSLTGTVGSDAHTLWEIGRSTQLIPDFQDSASLKRVINQAKAKTNLSPLWIHFFSRFASVYKQFTHFRQSDIQ
jgi:predicted metal-dependent phosphoesterase TrpH